MKACSPRFPTPKLRLEVPPCQHLEALNGASVYQNRFQNADSIIVIPAKPEVSLNEVKDLSQENAVFVFCTSMIGGKTEMVGQALAIVDAKYCVCIAYVDRQKHDGLSYRGDRGTYNPVEK